VENTVNVMVMDGDRTALDQDAVKGAAVRIDSLTENLKRDVKYESEKESVSRVRVTQGCGRLSHDACLLLFHVRVIL
jgi:hypothetical protein